MRDGSGRDRGLADPQRAAQRGCGCDVGERPPRRRRRDRQLDPRRHGGPRRRNATVPRPGSSGCSPPTPARASCVTPTPATTRRSTLPARAGSTCPRRRADGSVTAAARRRPRLLVRDLAQVATPCRSRRTAARGGARSRRRRRGCLRPLRGRSRRGGRADARPARRSTAMSRSSTAPVSARSPGSIDCHTHLCFAGDRVGEFALRAGGATYEELHAAGGGIVSTVRATRAAEQRRAAPLPSSGTAAGCAAAAPRPSRGSPATASTTTPSSRSWRPSGPQAASRPGWARTRCRRSSTTGTPTSTSCSRTSCRRPRRSPRRPTSSSSAAPSTKRRPAAISRPAPRPVSSCRLHGDQFTESGAIPLAVELGARSVDHLEATGAGRRADARGERRHRRAPPGERALPRPPDAAGPRARRRRRRDRARDRLQPGQRVLREPAARLLPRVHAAPTWRRRRRSPPAPSTPRTCSAGPDRLGRLAPGFRADLVLLAAADWRHLAYHLGGDVVHTVIEGGAVASPVLRA